MDLKSYLQKNLSPATAARYERDLQLFFFHLKQPGTATYKQIMDVIGVLRKKYSNPKTVNRILAAIKKYYDYLLHTGTRKDHPCKSIALRDTRRRNIQLQDLFSTQELEYLIESKPKSQHKNRKTNQIRNKLLLSLLIYQGMARTEISKIEIDDINLEEGTIRARGDERTSSRTLPLKAKQVHLIYEYIHKERPETESGKLFIGLRGDPMSSDCLCRIVLRYQYLFPEKMLNSQTIRMSVTRNLLKEGKDIRVVQTYMGHKSPGTTEKYKQSHTEALKAEIQKYHPIK
ncbi:MAG: tyrosine-type recombinase/integrase [Cyclobacteriaceae bacterium]|nr:tyrosine-type recombinase/integrase [Cyclobacteriaceae bacterium]